MNRVAAGPDAVSFDHAAGRGDHLAGYGPEPSGV